jgi:antirestriction protein ArdC
MADDPIDAAEALKQEFFDEKRWNYDAIDAIAKAMTPKYNFDALFTEFARVQGKYPSLAYAMWYGNEAERGEMPTWVEFMKLYGDVFVPMTGPTDREIGNMHDLVKQYKREAHTKPARTGAPEAQPKCCAVCKSPADGCCDACGLAYYCDEACQRADWAGAHKEVCANISSLTLGSDSDEDEDEFALTADGAPLIGAQQRKRKKPSKKVMRTKKRPKPPIVIDVPTKGAFNVVSVLNKATTGEWGLYVLAGLKEVVIIAPVELSRDTLVGIMREIQDGLANRDTNYTKAFVESGVLIPTKPIDPVNPRWRDTLDQNKELLAGILDDEGNVLSGMPWQRPYRVWPIMNFWRLYRATRQKNRVPGKLHTDVSLRYRGVNKLTLEDDYHGRKDPAGRGAMLPFYLTVVQARDLGGVVRPGAKLITITRWIPDRSISDSARKASKSAAATRDAAQRGFARKYPIVRVEDVGGVEFERKLMEVLALMAKEDDRVTVATTDPTPEQVHEAIHAVPLDAETVSARAQSLLNEIMMADTDAPAIVWDVAVIPHYMPRLDQVRMPPRGAFTEPQKMWHTVFHELTHWTNKEGRVKRDFSEEGHFSTASLTGEGTRTVFQDEEMPPKSKRAVEELIAEIGAFMLLGEAGLDTQPWAGPMAQAYIRSWAAELTMEAGKRYWLSKAAGLASEAVDYLLRSRRDHVFGDIDIDIEAQQAEEFVEETKEEEPM